MLWQWFKMDYEVITLCEIWVPLPCPTFTFTEMFRHNILHIWKRKIMWNMSKFCSDIIFCHCWIWLVTTFAFGDESSIFITSCDFCPTWCYLYWPVVILLDMLLISSIMGLYHWHVMSPESRFNEISFWFTVGSHKDMILWQFVTCHAMTHSGLISLLSSYYIVGMDTELLIHLSSREIPR